MATAAASLVVAACSSDNTANDGGSDASSGVDATMEAGAIDAKPDVRDSAPKDTGPMCPIPVDVMNFMPPMFVQPRAPINACNNTQLQGYWANCRDLNTSSMNACQTWKSMNMSCASCVESQRSDMSWGPLVLGNGITFANTNGCIALKGDLNCAKAEQALGFCDYAACDPACPVTDFFAPDHASTLSDWQKCSQTADATVCKSFVQSAQSACAVDAGSPAAVCSNFMDFKSAFFLLAPMFCSAGG